MSLFRNVTARDMLIALVVLCLVVVVVACSSDDESNPSVTADPEASPSTQAVQEQQVVESQQSRAAQLTEQAEQTADQQQQQVDRQPQSEQAEKQSESPDQQSSEELQQEQVVSRPTITPDALVIAAEPILDGYEFRQPIELVSLPDGSLLVAEQRGSVTRFVPDGDDFDQFGILDLTESVSFGGEEGLLSVALDPDLANKPFLYVYYSPSDGGLTRLSRFRIVQGAALLASELVILEIRQPYRNHNGGAVRFGPDGMLYLGIGDGGAANDPQGHGQNRETLLGTIIRIDVHDIDTATPYRIPTDNPFLGLAGVRPEIWAYGLRNPWRMAFDPISGDLWVGDVGQDRAEEIAIVRAGENHGWNVFEGDECFRNADDCAMLSDAVGPVSTYGHDEGCSVTGGVVYRGARLPELHGVYLFGDYCSSTIWGLWPDDAAETGWNRHALLTLDGRIASFGVDNDGEVHVLTFNGPILKLVPSAR